MKNKKKEKRKQKKASSSSLAALPPFTFRRSLYHLHTTTPPPMTIRRLRLHYLRRPFKTNLHHNRPFRSTHRQTLSPRLRFQHNNIASSFTSLIFFLPSRITINDIPRRRSTQQRHANKTHLLHIIKMFTTITCTTA